MTQKSTLVWGSPDTDIVIMWNASDLKYPLCRVLSSPQHEASDNPPSHPPQSPPVMDDETQSDLSTEQLHQVCDMMLDFPDGFMAPGAKRGETDVTEHGMDMQNNAPVKQRWKPWPRAKMEAADELVQQMLEDDVIEPSDSPWASPAVLVTKKDGTIRFVLTTEKWFFFWQRRIPILSHRLTTL